MTNILIGVGGTGAKVVEAILVLCAAGLGPEGDLHVGLVDQDNANGNVSRTLALLRKLRDVRDRWRSGDHKIDWAHGGQQRMLFNRSELKPLFGSDGLWCPGGDEGSLKSILGHNLSPARKDLLDLLYMDNEEEQTLKLDEGYRGRAHVGAAALISKLSDPGNVFTSTLDGLMRTGGDAPVNIFIVGSAFGGTGAAGFPTLARELHRLRMTGDFTNKSAIRIAGTLMLPYFSFKNPDDKEEEKLVVTADELLPKAQLALEYYERLFEQERTFDSFYVLGWERFLPLGYHQAGNDEQKNPALVPELFAASAAIEFLGSQPEEEAAGEGEAQAKVPLYLSTRHGPDVQWIDLPRMRERLGQLLRFAAYWIYTVEPLLNEPGGFLDFRTNWAKKLKGKAKIQELAAEMKALDEALRHVLTWAAQVERTARWGTGLWQLDGFVEENPDNPTEPVTLRPRQHDAPSHFDYVIPDARGLGQDSSDVHNQLTERAETIAAASDGRGPAKHAGLGRVVAATYNAVALKATETQANG
jgi:hypothetical protein